MSPDPPNFNLCPLVDCRPSEPTYLFLRVAGIPYRNAGNPLIYDGLGGNVETAQVFTTATGRLGKT